MTSNQAPPHNIHSSEVGSGPDIFSRNWHLKTEEPVWGVFVRTVYVWHITWAVNSLCHLAGYRSHETADESRNNWFVAIITGGEGWHNNHHHDPASASVQHRWWEIDLNFHIIKSLEWLGLATHVVHPRQQRLRERGSAVL